MAKELMFQNRHIERMGVTLLCSDRSNSSMDANKRKRNNHILVLRFIDYKPTSLEMEYKFEVQCEMDIGLNLDLIDPNTYKVDNSSEIQLNEKDALLLEDEDANAKQIKRQEIKVGYNLTKNKENLNIFRDRQSQITSITKSFEDLNEKDALLLEDEDANAKQIKRSAQHSKVVPWMRKTQYISSEFNRFGVAADRQEIKVGYNLTKNKENLNIFRDRQSQITSITKSFEDSKVPIRKHFTKKGVTAVEEIPILPDFTLWKYPFAVVQFDVDPTPTNFAPELCDSMVTQSYIK
ncbi:hypothetical protein TELCIR_16635 [Teladorsagia circumcincta]|uniref:RNA polymerase II-associated factor 1 homolog n=1 Tax=Teladorsagia circumcincta TaxID=45464 RepID=A0A2G9TUX9_TELCI|nr:hypothetical protein TELCIR_16635 [Teladorsagia circumcincta]